MLLLHVGQVDVHKVTSAGISPWTTERVVLVEPASSVISKSTTVDEPGFPPEQDDSMSAISSAATMKPLAASNLGRP